MEKGSVLPLLEAMMLLQGTILSSVDRKQFPFSKAQLNIFTVLAVKGEVTMKQAAGYLACSREQATRAVAPLADAGYVERRTDPANRTRIFIRLTEEGKGYLREQHEDLASRLGERMDRALTEREKTALFDDVSGLTALLKKVRDIY